MILFLLLLKACWCVFFRIVLNVVFLDDKKGVLYKPALAKKNGKRGL